MIRIKLVENEAELSEAHQIRKEVFVIEQNCPEEIEWEHEEESKHYIAIHNNLIIGTARWRKTDNGYKLERFAVLKTNRKQGIGSLLLKKILSEIPSDNNTIYLHAQLAAKVFYIKHGFSPIGDNVWEGGIEHIKMYLPKE